MKRASSLPWIHRRSRPLIGAIALLGFVETAFLTGAEWLGSAADICPTTGCKDVLESPYASLFGLPLSLFGCLAYGTVALLALVPLMGQQASAPSLRVSPRASGGEEWGWRLLFGLTLGMAIASSYLVYVMVAKVQALCPYCLASAGLSLLLFLLACVGRYWEDIGQLLLTGTLTGTVTLIAVLGIYANANATVAPTVAPTATPRGVVPPPIQHVSGSGEIALAQHLRAIGAREYGAYWCPHCQEQKELFGREAFAIIDGVECDPKGQNARSQLCQAAGIKGFPTWEIQGRFYEGVQSLDSLAEASGYPGERNFQYVSPYP